MICFVDQCVNNNTHQCKDGRICIPSYEDWSYSCGNCTDFFRNDGNFNCLPSDLMIITISVSIAGLFPIVVIILYFRKKKLDLFLPQNWLWEINYFSTGYKKHSKTPLCYLKQIDLKDSQMNQSKEYKLFKYLKGIMDFDNLIISKLFAVSSPDLAGSMSNFRKTMIERMKSSPEIFKSESWKKPTKVWIKI